MREQIATAFDALEDWRDIVPEEIREVEERIEASTNRYHYGADGVTESELQIQAIKGKVAPTSHAPIARPERRCRGWCEGGDGVRRPFHEGRRHC